MAVVKVKFSNAIQTAVNGEAEKEIEYAGDVGTLIEKLGQTYGDEFKKRVAPNGSLNKFINIYVNGEDVRFLKELDTVVKSGDVVYIAPAVSGG